MRGYGLLVIVPPSAAKELMPHFWQLGNEPFEAAFPKCRRISPRVPVLPGRAQARAASKVPAIYGHPMRILSVLLKNPTRFPALGS